MGLFLSLSGVAGASAEAVELSLRRFAEGHGGTLIPARPDTTERDAVLIWEPSPQRVVVRYPLGEVDYERPSKHLSGDLKTSVVGLHIHDGDFWLYTLYVSGREKDAFSAISNYHEGMSERAARHWRGKPATLAKNWPGLLAADVGRYFVDWTSGVSGKAYPDDEFSYGQDYQLADFMRPLGLRFPALEDATQPGSRFVIELPASEVGSAATFCFTSMFARTPVENAAKLGDRTKTEQLLAAARETSSYEMLLRTAVLGALIGGHLEWADELLAGGARLDAEPRIPPLIIEAVIGGASPESIRFLIARGCRVDESDLGGNTPLHIAAGIGRAEVVRCLIDHGAEVNSRNHSGSTPLDSAKKVPKVAAIVSQSPVARSGEQTVFFYSDEVIAQLRDHGAG